MKEEINILFFSVVEKGCVWMFGEEKTNCEDLDNLSNDIVLE